MNCFPRELLYLEGIVIRQIDVVIVIDAADCRVHVNGDI